MSFINNLHFLTNIFIYTQWSAYATGFFFLLAIFGFFLKWGIRFRLVGITSFMGVLTLGLLGVGLSFHPRELVPGSVRYSTVYDNASGRVVIVVPPQVNESQVEASLQQAANDYFSLGRISQGAELTIRVRTILHPEKGISQPLYLGQAKRSLLSREDQNIEIRLFPQNFALLPEELEEESAE